MTIRINQLTVVAAVTGAASFAGEDPNSEGNATRKYTAVEIVQNNTIPGTGDIFAMLGAANVFTNTMNIEMEGSPANICLTSYSNDVFTAGAFFDGERARGTKASPTAIQTGDHIVTLGAFGHGIAPGFILGGYIQFSASANWTNDIQPTKFELYTSNLQNSPELRLTIAADGQATFTNNIKIDKSETAASVQITTSLLASGQSSFFDGRRSQVGETAIENGNILSSFRASGHDGDGYFLGGQLVYQAMGEWTSISHPTQFSVTTTNFGSTDSFKEFTIEANGTADFQGNDIKLGLGNIILKDANTKIFSDSNGNVHVETVSDRTFALMMGPSLVTNVEYVFNQFQANFMSNNLINVHDLQLDGRFKESQGSNVDSANDITLPNDGNTFFINNDVDIERINNLDWQAGSIINLVFTDTVTVFNNITSSGTLRKILLAGGANYTFVSNNVLSLTLDISNFNGWVEVSRATVHATGGSLNELTDVTITGSTVNDLLVSDNEGQFINRTGVFVAITGLGPQSQGLAMNNQNISLGTGDIILGPSNAIRIFEEDNSLVFEVEGNKSTILTYSADPRYSFEPRFVNFHTDQRIINLGNPQDVQDAATNFTAGSGSGFITKQSVNVATTTNVNLATQIRASQDIDGITLVEGDRVLVKDQDTSSQNGIYDVFDVNTVTQRSADSNSQVDLDDSGVFVLDGSTFAKKTFIQTENVSTFGGSPVLYREHKFYPQQKQQIHKRSADISQTINGLQGATRILGLLSDVLPDRPGRFAVVVATVNSKSNQLDKDMYYAIRENGNIISDSAVQTFYPLTDRFKTTLLSFVVEMLGQIIDVVADPSKANEEPSLLTVTTQTSSDYQSMLQITELA